MSQQTNKEKIRSIDSVEESTCLIAEDMASAAEEAASSRLASSGFFTLKTLEHGDGTEVTLDADCRLLHEDGSERFEVQTCVHADGCLVGDAELDYTEGDTTAELARLLQVAKDSIKHEEMLRIYEEEKL